MRKVILAELFSHEGVGCSGTDGFNPVQAHKDAGRMLPFVFVRRFV